METATHSSVLEHLKTMSDEDCKEQISFIRQSFQAQQSKVHSKLERAPPKETGGKTPILTSQEILAHAEKIAETILEHATETDQKSLGWLALEPLSDLEQFVLRPTSDTLYSGRSGIALFFAALYAFSHKNKWKEAAIKSIYGLQSTLAKNPHNRWIAAHGIGGMSGVGGVLYSLLKIGLLLDDSSIIKTAQSLLDSIEEKHILKDTSYDLLGGSAGLLLALLCWHETFHDEKSLNLSEICGNHLIASALNMGDDIVAWKGTGKQPLLGASHGTSGIAYALFKLSQFAKNPKFAKVAKGAIEYDRSHFSKERGNWSDFRSSTKAYPVNWCHGAPGIGLTRLGSLLYFQDEYFLKEIEIAQETTKEHLFSEHSHLCCGSFGRLELFIEAERSQTQHDLKPFILQAASTLCSQMTQSLNAGPMFSPSFMFGSAGVGYTLLRCIDAKHILPQVLLLQT